MQQERVDSYTGFTNDVRNLYGFDAFVYGPYLRNSDKRAFVLIRQGDRTKQVTKLYAKVLLEIREGRILGKDETVDHIDGNPFNDSLDNLAILSMAENTRKSCRKRVRTPVPCSLCSAMFIPTTAQVCKRGQSKAGPFCSRVCTGKYGKEVQKTGLTKERNQIAVEYYQ